MGNGVPPTPLATCADLDSHGPSPPSLDNTPGLSLEMIGYQYSGVENTRDPYTKILLSRPVPICTKTATHRGHPRLNDKEVTPGQHGCFP